MSRLIRFRRLELTGLCADARSGLFAAEDAVVCRAVADHRHPARAARFADEERGEGVDGDVLEGQGDAAGGEGPAVFLEEGRQQDGRRGRSGGGGDGAVGL